MSLSQALTIRGTLNRTILELKLFKARVRSSAFFALNRTILELKYGWNVRERSDFGSLNRTILELKLQTG